LGASYGALVVIRFIVREGSLSGVLWYHDLAFVGIGMLFGGIFGILMGAVVGLPNGLIMMILMIWLSKFVPPTHYQQYVQFTKYVGIIVYMVGTTMLIKYLNLHRLDHQLGDTVLIIPMLAGIGAWWMHNRLRAWYLGAYVQY
jgi:hypothetical protein